jgi:histidinol phosphatase-like PHP family hydrolase
MKVNLHTHTYRCNHAHGTDEEFVQAAIETGYTKLGFSDHNPFPYDNGYYNKQKMLPEMLDSYIERYWSPIKESEQPFEAFRINSGHILNALIRAVEEEGDKDEEKESHSFIHSSREEAKMRYLGGSLGKGVVMLSDEQFDSLLTELSVEEFDKYVGIVADMELSGKHYKKKTHYQAILDMAAKDRRTNG